MAAFNCGAAWPGNPPCRLCSDTLLRVLQHAEAGVQGRAKRLASGARYDHGSLASFAGRQPHRRIVGLNPGACGWLPPFGWAQRKGRRARPDSRAIHAPDFSAGNGCLLAFGELERHARQGIRPVVSRETSAWVASVAIVAEAAPYQSVGRRRASTLSSRRICLRPWVGRQGGYMDGGVPCLVTATPSGLPGVDVEDRTQPQCGGVRGQRWTPFVQFSKRPRLRRPHLYRWTAAVSGQPGWVCSHPGVASGCMWRPQRPHAPPFSFQTARALPIAIRVLPSWREPKRRYRAATLYTGRRDLTDPGGDFRAARGVWACWDARFQAARLPRALLGEGTAGSTTCRRA